MANDIKLTDTNDLYITDDGDFKIADSDACHIEQILISEPGHWRASPLTGIGILKSLNAPTTTVTNQALKQRIKLQLELDDYQVNSIDLTNPLDINIDANRIQ